MLKLNCPRSTMGVTMSQKRMKSRLFLKRQTSQIPAAAETEWVFVEITYALVCDKDSSHLSTVLHENLSIIRIYNSRSKTPLRTLSNPLINTSALLKMTTPIISDPKNKPRNPWRKKFTRVEPVMYNAWIWFVMYNKSFISTALT